MVLYEFKCSGGHEWEKFRPMSDHKKGSMCPECGKKGSKLVGISAVRHGETIHTSRQLKRREEDFWAGKDKDRAKEFYNESIDDLKKTKKETPYTAYHPNVEVFEKAGMIKKLSPEESAKKRKRAEKLTRDAYNKAGIDPTEQRPESGQNI